MGLDKEDVIPFGISLDEAYSKIVAFLLREDQSILEYCAKAEKENNGNDTNDGLIEPKVPYHQLLKLLTSYLINHPLNSEIEKQVVLFEVICGNLEQFYHSYIDQYKVAAYAESVLRRRKPEYWLNDTEKRQLLEKNIELHNLISRHNRLHS